MCNMGAKLVNVPEKSMILRMTIVGDVKPPDPQDISHSFGSQGGRIGRGLSNEWALPDPHMSKNHCSIQFRDGKFSLTDTSTNGVFVNGSPDRMERGASVAISDGDHVKIGDYEIKIEIDTSAGTDAADAVEDLDSFARVLGVGLGENLDPFDINSANRAETAEEPQPESAVRDEEDPLDALLDQPAPSLPQDAPLPSARGPSGAVIPEDDDLFDDLLSGGSGNSGDDPLESLSPEQDHAPSSQEFFQPPGVVGAQIPDDWDHDDLLNPTPDTPKAPSPPPAVEVPRPQAAPIPPEPKAPAAARAPAAISEADGALLRAFLEGAGMTDLEVPAASQLELMRSVGETYRDLVRGLVEVLKARQTIKNEFRLDQTMIRADANNPLKFTVNIEDALQAMLGGTSRGYLTPRQAVDQGFADIKAHQIAVMAGMQVALKALLTRFDPKELEDRLREDSVLNKVLPGSKKARHWELFTKLYAEIAKEAEDDFHGLFGREFARAYEEQAKKV